MTDNGAMSYTEGSEPIKLTEDNERIGRERLLRTLAKENLITLIMSYEYENKELKHQLKEERNKAIDECIERLSSYRDIDRTQMKEELQSLKSDSK